MNSTLEKSTFLALLLVTSAAFAWVLNPFFSPIFWACVIALLFYPMQQKLCQRLGQRRNLAALLTLVICVVIVIIPTTVLISALVSELRSFYSDLTENGEGLDDYIEKLKNSAPALQEFLPKVGLNVDSLEDSIKQAATKVGEFLAQRTLTIGQNTLFFFVNLGLMLYLAFFLLRDGRTIVGALLQALPLSANRERLLANKFSEVVRATIKGNVIIALVEGSLGGLIFWILGIGNALLWGTAMVAVSLIPVIGAGVIWVPAAIYLVVTGDYGKGIVLTLYGLIVIGLVDNFLRPIVVGKDTKLPDYVVLFSTLGGLALFGVDGFVIGPLIAALFVVLWQIFVKEFDTNGDG